MSVNPTRPPYRLLRAIGRLAASPCVARYRTAARWRNHRPMAQQSIDGVHYSTWAQFHWPHSWSTFYVWCEARRSSAQVRTALSVGGCANERQVHRLRKSVNPFDVHCCCNMGTDIKHPVSDRVKPAFVIFDIRSLWRSGFNPVWHRMLYSCTHIATMGVKGLIMARRALHIDQTELQK